MSIGEVTFDDRVAIITGAGVSIFSRVAIMTGPEVKVGDGVAAPSAEDIMANMEKIDDVPI